MDEAVFSLVYKRPKLPDAQTFLGCAAQRAARALRVMRKNVYKRKVFGTIWIPGIFGYGEAQKPL